MILVTGGAGVMGSVLVRRLAEQGARVRVTALPDDSAIRRLDGLNVEIRRLDLCNRQEVQGLCEGVITVCHLAAVIIARDDDEYRRVNIEVTRALVQEAMRAAVSHFVHVSSASVVYPKTTAYSRSKRESERVVIESGLGYTIIRPTLVYDRSGGQEFNAFLDYLGRFPIVPFIGAGKARKRPVHVDDIVDGLVKVAGSEKPHNRIYNFSGAESITMIGFARLCLKLMGTGNKPVVHFPVWLCRLMAVLMGCVMKLPPLRWPVIAGVIQDADLDPSEATREVGYNPGRVSEQLPRCFPRSA